MDSNMIYFIPQNGLVSRCPIRSNFYVYRLREKCLAKVELATNKAKLGSGGYVHEPEFLSWLAENDTEWDQKEGLEP